MNVTYCPVSVWENKGVDELVQTVIENCIILEKDLIAYTAREIDKNKQTKPESETPGKPVTGAVSSAPDV
jgi:hypothetical protein